MPAYLLSEQTKNNVIKQTDAARRKGPEAKGQTYKPASPVEPFWAKLVAQSTTAPGRYSWSKVVPSGTGTFADAQPIVSSGTDFTAIEINNFGGLPAGHRVQLWFAGYDGSEKPVYHFNGIGATFGVQITSPASGGGVYLAKMVLPSNSAPGLSGSLGLAHYGAATSTTVIVFNEAEQGTGTHSLAPGSVYTARGWRVSSDGTLIVSLWALRTTPCAGQG